MLLTLKIVRKDGTAVYEHVDQQCVTLKKTGEISFFKLQRAASSLAGFRAVVTAVSREADGGQRWHFRQVVA